MSVFRNLDCLSLVVCSNTTLLILQTEFFFLLFSKFCPSKSGVRLIYGCGLYTDVYGMYLRCSASVTIISQSHFVNISFTHHSFHRNTSAQQIHKLTSEWLHSSVGKSSAYAVQRSWVQILLKTPTNFMVHI